MAKLAFRLPEIGYKVISVPEVATLLREGGVNTESSLLDPVQQIRIQLRVLKLRIAIEDIFTEIAEGKSGKVVVLCNSGVIDGSAYVSKDIWQAILDELGVTQVHLRDFRYDAVIHLVTTAQGAEKYYDTKKNIDSIEDARKIDKLLQEGYTGHPKFSIIDNEGIGAFDEKLQKVIDIVFNTLGVQATNQNSYKFLVDVETDKGLIPIIPEYIKYQKIFVEETFLNSSPKEIIRVQKRGHSDSYNYLYSIEKISDDGTIKVASQIISPRDYMNYLKERDDMRNTVKRLLHCFIHDRNYMILDTFLSIKFKGSLLRVETNNSLDEITFPEFIQVKRNVKDDPGYSTHKLAKINWYESQGEA